MDWMSQESSVLSVGGVSTKDESKAWLFFFSPTPLSPPRPSQLKTTLLAQLKTQNYSTRGRIVQVPIDKTLKPYRNYQRAKLRPQTTTPRF
jgi:hypothetical protein